MNFDGLSLSNYWSNESKIKEARQVFFAKGVIRRELIADDLAFSWLRCKYKGTSSTEIPYQPTSRFGRVPMKKTPKKTLILNDLWVGVFDYDGKLKHHLGNASMGQKFEGWSFLEATAGFNGIGTCLENRKLSMTVGYEHYHDALCDYISIGMPYGEDLIGFILPLQIADDELIEKLLANSFSHYYQIETDLEFPPPYDLHFFREDFEAFKQCYMTFTQLSKVHSHLFIVGDYLQDAYELALKIHEERVQSHNEFLYLSAMRCINTQVSELIRDDFKGTLFIEDVNWLPIAFQEKINEIIDCKLINSKSCNDLYKSDLSIIVFKKYDEFKKDNEPDVYAPLQANLLKSQLCIPSFHKLGRSFKSYLYDEFENICYKRGYRSLHLSEAVLKLLTIYHWPLGYQELRCMADYIANQTFDGDEVPLKALPNYLIQLGERTEENLSLKYAEQIWIEKVLTQCEGNIKRAAMQLGITRTTLYKKMDEYHIKV